MAKRESGADADEPELVYNPDQDPDEKRKLRAGYREITRQQNDLRTDLANVKIGQLVAQQKRADMYFEKVRAPQEAALDSKVLLQNAEMGAAMARAMKHDTAAFDMDEYVTKLVTFMGGRSAEKDNDDGEAQDDGGLELDWSRIGTKALMFSRKAPCMDFMVGPLSVEVKQRKKVSRARVEKDRRPAVRPQELGAEDIQRSENETTKMVAQLDRLLAGQDRIGLLEFIINPESFGQSMENLFYLSFLVRDGKCAIESDETRGGVLTVFACEPPAEDERPDKKQQQVFILTPQIWREAKELFNISKPCIPHRSRPQEYDSEVKNELFLV